MNINLNFVCFSLPACIVNCAPGFLLALLYLTLCAKSPVVAGLIFQVVGYHVMSFPCIMDGNKFCLTYDIAIYGAKNFRKIAELAGKNTPLGKTFTLMADLCDKAVADIKKLKNPEDISKRTCKLVQDLAAAAKAYGACLCSLLQRLANVPQLLTILKPEVLKKILSPHNLKYFFQIGHLLNISGSLKNLPKTMVKSLHGVGNTVKNLNLDFLSFL